MATCTPPGVSGSNGSRSGVRPGRRQRPHRGAVVGELARDQLVPGRLAARVVVGLGELPRRLDRLRAAGGEEHAVEVSRRELGDPRGQLDRARVGVAPVGVEAELLRLRAAAAPELRAAVADVHAVQRRQAVEVALAVLVVDVAALAPDDHRHLVALGVGAHAREVHPQVSLGLLLEITGHWRHAFSLVRLDTEDNANRSAICASMRRVVNNLRCHCTTRPTRRGRFGDRAHCASAGRVRTVPHKPRAVSAAATERSR